MVVLSCMGVLLSMSLLTLFSPRSMLMAVLSFHSSVDIYKPVPGSVGASGALYWHRQTHAGSGSRLLMLLHYLLVLPALDGQAAHSGEHHDCDREDQGRAHRAHEAMLEDLL